jgi:hypothetical protein
MTTPYRKQADVPDYTPPMPVIKQACLWQRLIHLPVANNQTVWHGSAFAVALIICGTEFSWMNPWFLLGTAAGIIGTGICAVFNKSF